MPVAIDGGAIPIMDNDNRANFGQNHEQRLSRDLSKRKLNLNELKSILIDRKANLLRNVDTPISSQYISPTEIVSQWSRSDPVPSGRSLLLDERMDKTPNVVDEAEADKNVKEEGREAKILEKAVNEEERVFQELPNQPEPHNRSDIIDQHFSDKSQLSQKQQSSVLLEQKSDEVSKMAVSKKKSKKKSFSLPDGFPLFESPYPPPVVDGRTCR